MKQAYLRLRCVLVFITCLLAACGGGGDGSPTASTTVSGVASKGPILGGNVNVYAVNADGSRGRLLGTATTSTTDGSYQVNDLGYNGNIIVVVTEGTYVDEATGITLPNPGLKAALPSATGAVKVAVTPLTDVAFKQMSSASGGFSSANITTFNSVVSTAFGVDIIGTQPVNATDATAIAGAGQAAIDYGVALAAISKMVDNGAATDVANAIQQIKADLSSATPQLTTTGPALSQAISDMTGGADPVLAPTITAGTISIDNSIDFFSGHSVNPPANASGVMQAKAMIGDLRNTVLSVINYQTGEVTAALQTPFNATVQEIETVIQPELTVAADRLGWVATSLGSIQGLGANQSYTFTDPVNHPGETLTIATAATGFTATTTIANATTTLLSGTVTVNDILVPTSGSMDITTLRTQSGNATASLDFTGTMSGLIYTAITLTGNITTPVATFDFSDSSKAQRLTANFAAVPGSPDSMMLTKAYFKGVAATTTARLTGTIDLPTLVWNANISPTSGNVAIPTSATISATIEALANGNPALTLTGTLTGAFANAATYNPNIQESSANFASWSGTFDGSIVAAGSGLNITTLLKASRPSFNTINFEAKYSRVLQDGSTIFLSSTGTSDLDTNITTANMTNQNGIQVALSHNDNLSVDSRLSGTINTSGGETVGNFSTVSGLPRVTYTDGYFESLF